MTPPLKLNGIFPSIPTPFTHSGEIYAAKIRHNIEKWNLTTLAGYLVTCESPYLSESEKLFLWEEVARFTPSTKILIVDTGVESVRESIRLTNLAAALGYRCALIRTPALPHDALYYRAIADQAQIPLILESNASIETIAALSQHPNLIALLNQDSQQVSPLIERARPGFQILHSNALSLAPALRAGAIGGILSYASAAPFSCLTIAEAVQRREYEAAEDWQTRITQAATLVSTHDGIPALKYAMDFNGYYGGVPRLPLIPVSRAVQLKIETAFHGLRG
ncbi:dihydrodipicolinate synthase family protein [Bryobacter aggregatus]|uniref:dihydrodipicolinate synthase family protein n=1 Tax=Bryobacter aggregatus TaxID=360054 RepID=UPI0004E11A9F|nr:dihydrodipicolinate synthase family protein [Bryobacter aggregatus]